MHSADYAVARCLSVRLSHADIVSQRRNTPSNFTQSDIHAILVFYTKRYGNIPAWKNAGGHEKIAIIDPYIALSRKLMPDRTIVILWNANRNSYVIYQMMLFPMTLSDLAKCSMTQSISWPL